MTALLVGGVAVGDRASTADLITAPTTGVRLALKVDAAQWLTAAPLAGYFGDALVLFAGGSPSVNWVDSGAVFHSTGALAPFPFTAGLRWVMVDLVFDDGSGDHTVEFAWSADATDDPDLVVWTSLGVDTIPGTTDLALAGGITTIGEGGGIPGLAAYHLVAQVQVDGVTVAQPEFLLEAAGTLTFTDGEGVDWSIDGTGAQIVAYPTPVVEVQLGGAVRSPMAGPPLIVVPEDVLNPLRIRVLRPGDLSHVVSLQSTLGDTAREQRNAVGSGSVTLLNDDPATALLRKYDIVQHIIEGQVAYSTLVEDITAVDVALEEEAGERTTYSGLGHIGLLRLGTVYPSRGAGAQPIERDRVFKWTASTYDDSSWPLAVNAGDADGFQRQQGSIQEGYPLDGPDIAGNYWAASPGDTSTIAPLGPVYYRAPVYNIPETAEYMMFWAPDNYGEIYGDSVLLDAVPIGGGARNFLEVRAVPVLLTAGPIQFSARVVNAPLIIGGIEIPEGVGINPVGLFFVLARLDSTGEIASVIGATSDGWRALGRPSTEPGMTPGEVALITLGEWQARATAAGHTVPPITTSATEQVDSGGQPWGVTPNIATKVSTDLLTFYTEIAATYWDMRLRPGSLVLDLYNKGTVFPTAVEYVTAPPDDPTVGNMQSHLRRIG